ncbi:Tex family protein [Eremococcus coleocola]|uniref:Tex-like protein N-terminal domain protein n=1 Tax=Eremococcus coleocola ACS-139-V-Col8 TaxID=908337 RepID=E4KPQ7_9LACT|nr:Tex family protein [Eremococcus coleocola]EFR31050.1 Tex-like protein N-terminal domain protein [Eremococcus coleocola ACS-139-V-Col8]
MTEYSPEQTQTFIKEVAAATKIKASQVKAVLDLLGEGNTIPFIARYRKEVTGSLDEVQIHDIEQAHHYATQLFDRKDEIIRLIDEQGKLTEDLQKEIAKATKLQTLEDIYRPYKQKRRTKAMIAIEQGLQPLADYILNPQTDQGDIVSYAGQFVTEDVESPEAALAGAHEILAQDVSDRANYREFIRKYTRYNGLLVSSVKSQEDDPQGVYQTYYDYSEKVSAVLPHRVLALNRAEKEGVLTVKIQAEEEPVLNYMLRHYVPKDLNEEKTAFVADAIQDAYRRFIGPSIEREIRNELTQVADSQAIEVFGDNLRHLLLQQPLKGKIVMGFDPAYRTGCKLAIINETGRVLTKSVIYPHKPASEAKRAQAEGQLLDLIQQYQVDVIAIGNGTASRESEQFVSQTIKNNNLATQFIVVNEAGASVYSASKIAREEFPDFQVEERSAVSIARRLQDPLAELIKIDPKSMGVGQYQHDVAQKELTEALDFVVNITVNQVGVDVNTASKQLLEHVSGLTAATANNLIALRDELGAFTNRDQIKDVKRLGPKTFEQAVGFLRILGGVNPLDQTSIHPESYAIAEQILADHGLALADLGSEESVAGLDKLDAQTLADQYDIGLETIKDILEGLKNPKADIRDGQPAPILRDDVMTMEDLEIGMQLQGVVRNVVDFGTFVDIGVKQDGLVHISRLSKKFIKHPSDVVSVGDILEVEVVELDLQKQRIGLKRVK